METKLQGIPELVKYTPTQEGIETDEFQKPLRREITWIMKKKRKTQNFCSSNHTVDVNRLKIEAYHVDLEEEVEFVGDHIHTLFPSETNGPLTHIFSFVGVVDLLSNLFHVNKLFHRVIVFMFQKSLVSMDLADLRLLLNKGPKCIPENVYLMCLPAFITQQRKDNYSYLETSTKNCLMSFLSSLGFNNIIKKLIEEYDMEYVVFPIWTLWYRVHKEFFFFSQTLSRILFDPNFKAGNLHIYRFLSSSKVHELIRVFKSKKFSIYPPTSVIRRKFKTGKQRYDHINANLHKYRSLYVPFFDIITSDEEEHIELFNLFCCSYEMKQEDISHFLGNFVDFKKNFILSVLGYIFSNEQLQIDLSKDVIGLMMRNKNLSIADISELFEFITKKRDISMNSVEYIAFCSVTKSVEDLEIEIQKLGNISKQKFPFELERIEDEKVISVICKYFPVNQKHLYTLLNLGNEKKFKLLFPYWKSENDSHNWSNLVGKAIEDGNNELFQQLIIKEDFLVGGLIICTLLQTRNSDIARFLINSDSFRKGNFYHSTISFCFSKKENHDVGVSLAKYIPYEELLQSVSYGLKIQQSEFVKSLMERVEWRDDFFYSYILDPRNDHKKGINIIKEELKPDLKLKGNCIKCKKFFPCVLEVWGIDAFYSSINGWMFPIIQELEREKKNISCRKCNHLLSIETHSESSESESESGSESEEEEEEEEGELQFSSQSSSSDER